SGIGVNEAFIWTEADGMVGLGFLPHAFLDGTQAFGISFDGTVIVGGGWGVIGVQSYKWTQDRGMAAIGDLPGGGLQPFSHAFGVSADALTVVGSGSTDLGSEAYVWDHQFGMRNLRDLLVDEYGLDLAGWRLVEARAVSAYGETIVGWGVHEGTEEAWLARLAPVCRADLDGDGVVAVADMLVLLASMGPCDTCEACLADLDGNCAVDVVDFMDMMAAWGPCP
ncbi:MAG: hypothetical protein ACYSUA_17785, partial [Planctomycetota bacterium]